MASLNPPKEPWPLDLVEHTAQREIQQLPYSQQLKDLLIAMLIVNEEARPTAQAIWQSIEEESKAGMLMSQRTSKHETKRVVQSCLYQAERDRESGLYDSALRELRRGRALLQQKNLQSPELYLELGRIFTLLSSWAEAEEMLQQGLKFVSPSSALADRLNECLAQIGVQNVCKPKAARRKLSQPLISLGREEMQVWSCSSKTLFSCRLGCSIEVDRGSRWVWMAEELFSSGGRW